MVAPQKKGRFLSIGEEKDVPAFLSILKSGKGVMKGEDKGKGILSEETHLLPCGLPLYDGIDDNATEQSQGEHWKNFEKAGCFDESWVQRSNREALVRRIYELEKELYEYQHHMGLLLIENKEWASKYDKIRQELVNTAENQKRLQASHIVTVNKLNIQEQSLKKALDCQKQSIADLVKTLNEMHAENTEVKMRYKSKLDEVLDMEASIQAKELEVVGKLQSLDVKLAEASRRMSEINRRVEAVKVDECRPQKSSSSIIIETNAYEKDVAQRSKDLQNWEQGLLEHRRLVKQQTILDDGDADTNIKHGILRKKVQDLGEAWKSWEMTNKTLELREENIELRLKSLDAKEKVGLQKLIDDHMSIMKSQQEEFKLEMEMKRRKLDEEFKKKLYILGMKESEIEWREIEISGKEHGKETEKLKERGDENERFGNSLEESLSKENENLKCEKDKLLAGYRLLDEKRLALEEAQKHLDDEKIRFGKWRYAEEDRLSKEKLSVTSHIFMSEYNGLNNFCVSGNLNYSNNPKTKIQENNLRSEKQHCLNEKGKISQPAIDNDEISQYIIQGVEEQVLHNENLSSINQEQLPETCTSLRFVVTDVEPTLSPSCKQNNDGSSVMQGENTDPFSQCTDSPSVVLGKQLPWIQEHARILNFSPNGKSLVSDVGSNAEALGQKAHGKFQSVLLVADNSSNVPINGLQSNTEAKLMDKIECSEGPLSPNSNCYLDILKPQVDDGLTKNKWYSLPSPRQQNDTQEIHPEAHSSHHLSKKRRHKVRSMTVYVKKSRSVNALVKDTEETLEDYSNNNEELTRSAKDVNHNDVLGKGCYFNHNLTAINASERTPVACASAKTAVELNRENAAVITGKGEAHHVSVFPLECGEGLEAHSGTDVPGSRRYNFRRSTLFHSVALTQKSADGTKRKKK